MSRHTRYPRLSEYAFLSDCHSSALVSRHGSIDWCCMPRFDSGSIFGRLLDWKRGGSCELHAVEGAVTGRNYLDGTLVLETRFRAGAGGGRVLDFFPLRVGGALDPHRQLVRVVEGTRGEIQMRLRIAARFDYGGVRPWLRRYGVNAFTAIGGDDALVISSDAELEAGEHELTAELRVRAGDRICLSIEYAAPEEIDRGRPNPPNGREIEKRLDQTVRIWRRWARNARFDGAEAS